MASTITAHAVQNLDIEDMPDVLVTHQPWALYQAFSLLIAEPFGWL
jgi:hypothetical protein